MCYDRLFHSGGNYCSERFNGLLAATGLVSKELNSNLVLVAPLLCFSAPLHIHACRKEAAPSSGLRTVVEGGVVQKKKSKKPYMGWEGGSGWNVMCSLVCGYTSCVVKAGLHGLCRACTGPLAFLRYLESLIQCQDRVTDQAVWVPGAGGPGESRGKNEGG